MTSCENKVSTLLIVDSVTHPGTPRKILNRHSPSVLLPVEIMKYQKGGRLNGDVL